MKITIRENTRLEGKHLGVNETHEVSKEHGEFLVRLGRAVEVKEKVKAEDIVNKSEELENTVVNREEDLKKVVTKRKNKSE